MLLLVAAAMAWYSVRKTNQLFDTGINDHVECAIAGTYLRQTQTAEKEKGLGSQFGPMLQPLVDAARTAGIGDIATVSAHQCTAAGRSYTHVILERGQTPVSVILTPRRNEEVFPRLLSGQVVDVAGIPVHEGRRRGYSVAGFESGAYLGYVVSALPDGQNGALATRLVPVIVRYTGA